MMYQNGILTRNICGIIVAALAIISDAPAANVVQRPTTTNRVSVSRPSAAASRMPTMAIKTGNTSTSSTSTSGTTQSTTTTTTTTNTTVAPVVEPSTTTTVDTSTVENKSAVFGSTLTSTSSSERDSAAASLADLVRAQRAALDAADATLAMAAATDLSGTGENLCDSTLRECMMQKCGANFSKCIGDTDTTFFDKMDTCRRSTDCTGHEYQLFSAEIKADRDLNAKLTAYNTTIDCGNNYDACIMSHCGATYSKCIGKSAGDDAIARCESIARSCTEYDSGLAMRTMAVFGELRQTAERQIATDEQRLYALREQMRSVCTRLGAMFDERSLDCVYTVNFRAGDDNTLFASKKLYAGSTFDCTQNWFGIDITTFRENAFRTTRAQTSASSAMLGSGLGQAAGAITSGAIDRAVQRYRAENALDDAIQDCIDNGYDDNGNKLSEEECRAMKGYNSNSSDGSTNGSGTDSQAEAAASALTSGQAALNQGASTDVSTQQPASQEEQSAQSTIHTDPKFAYNSKTLELSGFVVDSNGNGIADVTVGINDSDDETKTDADGFYVLSNVNSDAKITFLPDPGTYQNIDEIDVKDVLYKHPLKPIMTQQARSMDSPTSPNDVEVGAPTSDLFANLMNKLQANKINVTSSNESNKIKMFVDNSVSKDKNVKLGYPAVETAPSATGIKYYLHLDYPSLVNRTDNEHGAFCLELDKSICSGTGSNCEVTYTGRSKCTFAYRL